MLCSFSDTVSISSTQDIYVIYRAGGPYWKKTVPEVLSTARGRRPRALLKTKGTVFSHTDLPRQVNNLFIFSVCLLFFFSQQFQFAANSADKNPDRGPYRKKLDRLRARD